MTAQQQTRGQITDLNYTQFADSLERVVDAIAGKRRAIALNRAVLVGISGIDAAGKGFVATHIAKRLEQREIKSGIINIDGWLNLPAARFDPENSAAHFYEYAIRFDELFTRLINPLVQNRSIELIADLTHETATTYRKHHYNFHDVDVVLLEGIFIYKRAYQKHFDLSVWIDCSFETALRRAIARSQEGLSEALTIEAYRRIYFAAQEIHFARDDPRQCADIIICNDSAI